MQKEIGRRIEAIRLERKMDRQEVGAAYYESGADAMRKIEDGTSGSDGFVKLARLAKVLRTTPNELLGFELIHQDGFRGVLEGIGLAIGLPLDRAVVLADTVLKVLNSPDIRSNGVPLRDSARSIVTYELRQFLRKERGEKA
jgi:hypothetical protein